VAITVEGPGTGDGFAKFCNGESDVSGASRAISRREIENCEANDIEFVELQVAVDGLSVITSAENDAVECLSFVDLYALLGPDATGINNWADASAAADEIAATVTDLGAVNTPYPDASLTVTAPGEESGTFDSFVEIVIESVGEALGVEDANVRPDYTASPNDNVIIEGIASNPTSLGWVGFAFVEENLDTIRPLQVDGGDGCIEPTPETIASGEFPIARPLFMYVSVRRSSRTPPSKPYVDFYVDEASHHPHRRRRGPGPLRAAERRTARRRPSASGKHARPAPAKAEFPLRLHGADPAPGVGAAACPHEPE
jgi:phosphate transport system substrate-binding protein